MVLIEVEEGLWVHASIDLPYTSRTPAAPSGKAGREYHDDLLPDAWVEESIRRAWKDYELLNGCPAYVLSQKAGRAGLERSLEKYFSVWSWSWDLELATNADAPLQQKSQFAECVEGFRVVARAPRSKLVQLMQSDSAQRLSKGREIVILSETAQLWPPTDAGCFEDETEDPDDSGMGLVKRSKSSSSHPASEQKGMLDSQSKAELLRRVVSHLTGLERERDLIRAASVSSTSDGRRRGTSGAIREKGFGASAGSKRDVRNGLLSAAGAGSKNRVVSSPIMQQRSASASSFASTESTKWSNWGSVFSGLGKLGGFKGSAESPTTATEVKKRGSGGEAGDSQISIAPFDIAPNAPSSPIEADTSTATDKSVSSSGEGASSSSPLQILNPIQEAGGKMWSGAELAFRGLGASLGLGHAPSTTERAGDNSIVSDEGRFADASFDRTGSSAGVGADADASVVTKVSILEPEVDVSELAEALGFDEDLSIASLPKESADRSVVEQEQAKPVLKVVTQIREAEASNLPNSPTSEALGASNDAASIKTSSSGSGGGASKAFPSISVTSAAWYKTSKRLRSETAATSSSPKVPTAASIFSNTEETAGTPDAFDTSLGGISVASEHHDFELDGWGHEQPQPFQSFKCYIGDHDVPLSYESLQQLQEQPFSSEEYKVSFTTRRLLTMVLIEPVHASAQAQDSTSLLDDAWQLLRRTQRMLNDHSRLLSSQSPSTDTSVRFLHLDGPTLTYQSSLDASNPSTEDQEVKVVAESHCTSAMELMRKHGVLETFARSSNGKTWTASRQGKGKGGGRGNETYMVLAGKKISIVDCDGEMRRLANSYPSFGI